MSRAGKRKTRKHPVQADEEEIDDVDRSLGG